VSRFAHPETGRVFAAKAANYFEKTAREALNAKAQSSKDAKILTADDADDADKEKEIRIIRVIRVIRG